MPSCKKQGSSKPRMLCPVPEQSRCPLTHWGSATGAVTLTVEKISGFISNALYTSAKGLSEETRRITTIQSLMRVSIKVNAASFTGIQNQEAVQYFVGRPATRLNPTTKMTSQKQLDPGKRQ